MSQSTQMPYREPVLLNAQLHRHKRLKNVDDLSMLAQSHAMILHVAEFGHACHAYPIIFVPGNASNPGITPVAMLGLRQNENLFVVDDGKRWDASYVPAYVRRIPYLSAPMPGSTEMGVYIDAQWPGLNEEEGLPLFGDDGQPAPALTQAIEFLKAYDTEQQRTQLLCERLKALDLFTEMKADIKLPDGTSLAIDGFMVVDEPKLAKLPENVVIELHRSGALGLIHAHLLSLLHLQRLIDRHVVKHDIRPVPGVTDDAPAANNAPAATAAND